MATFEGLLVDRPHPETRRNFTDSWSYALITMFKGDEVPGGPGRGWPWSCDMGELQVYLQNLESVVVTLHQGVTYKQPA